VFGAGEQKSGGRKQLFHRNMLVNLCIIFLTFARFGEASAPQPNMPIHVD